MEQILDLKWAILASVFIYFSIFGIRVFDILSFLLNFNQVDGSPKKILFL